MTKIILCCSCFKMDKKASEAFSILFPKQTLPKIIKGRDRIHKFSQEVGNEHIKAISKLSGRFAYYLEIDGDKIIKEYDLVKRTRLA